MNSRTRGLIILATILVSATSPEAATLPEAQSSDSLLALGLDHIPLAVTDLAAAAEHYRQLGFTLKPGRPHENGIQNQHVKFPDGTEMELITAADARDALTAEYLRHLAKGDGPAFVSLFAPDMDGLARFLDAAGRTYQRDGGLLSFPEGDELRYIFFGQRSSSPTDRPEHFRHANGAEALIGVWIAGDDLAAERELLAGLGATIMVEGVHVPDAVPAAVARLPLGEIILVPGSRQIVPGRRIVGATLRVQNLRALQQALGSGSREALPIVQTAHGSSIFLPPDITHGIWLEFREAN